MTDEITATDKECRYCKQLIKKEASVCNHCQKVAMRNVGPLKLFAIVFFTPLTVWFITQKRGYSKLTVRVTWIWYAFWILAFYSVKHAGKEARQNQTNISREKVESAMFVKDLMNAQSKFCKDSERLTECFVESAKVCDKHKMLIAKDNYKYRNFIISSRNFCNEFKKISNSKNLTPKLINDSFERQTSYLEAIMKAVEHI